MPTAVDTGVRFTNAFSVTYDYLVTGEMTAVREGGAQSGIGVLALYDYDDLGRRVSLTRGNGTNVSYRYDTFLPRLTGMSLGHYSAGNDYSYSYNPAGQIYSRTMSNEAYSWTGDYAANRGYGVNGLNQYTTAGDIAHANTNSVTPTYDPRGNLTSAGSATYTYSIDNQLYSAPGGTYRYDALDRMLLNRHGHRSLGNRRNSRCARSANSREGVAAFVGGEGVEHRATRRQVASWLTRRPVQKRRPLRARQSVS